VTAVYPSQQRAAPLAYLFAAGRSQRLGSITSDIPKSLLDVGGRRLVDYHLEAIASCGIRHIAIVVGYRRGQYRAAVGPSYRGIPITYVENPWHDEYGQVHSLRVGRELFDRPVLLVNADVFCPVSFYERLLAARSADDNVMLLDPHYPVLTGDEVIIQGRDGRVTGLALGSPADAQGEFVGLNRFSAPFLAEWCDYIDRTFATRWQGANYEWALDRFLREHPGVRVRYVAVDTTEWVNVNYGEDLATARRMAARRPAGAPR
jgi:choline kinase